MIKRSESKSKFSRRKHRPAEVRRKRSLKVEGLERRELLAVLLEPPNVPALDLPDYPINRNIGTVQSFTAIESERLNETGLNDFISNADILPLGTGPGQQDTIDVTGRLPVDLSSSSTSGFSADIDTFGFELRAGDILDIATLGAAGGITVRDEVGSLHIISDVPIGGVSAPRQNFGNANVTMVVPSDGSYFVSISPQLADTTANYILGLRVYRPVSESLAVGDTQVLYLDYAGAIIDNNVFNQQLADDNAGLPVGGVTRVRSLADSLPVLGLQIGDKAAENFIIDTVESELERMFEDLVGKGNNGDLESPNAQLGDYGIRILNSRDHFGAVTFDDPRVSRILVGGIGEDFGVDGVFGIAENVDVGNFNMDEFAIFALDAFAAFAATVPRSPAASDLDIVARLLGSVAAHEAGHIFGMIHTDNGDDPPVNLIGTASDAGGTLSSFVYMLGLGPDFIFRTSDDVLPTFNNDFFQIGEVPDLGGFAFNRVTQSMAHALSSGTIGATVSGRAFNDLNKNGNGSGDPGLGGVSVFADSNGNGVFDAAEPTDVTDASGSFQLEVADSRVNVVAATPAGFTATTATTQSGANIAFGFSETDVSITGTVFSDNDGSGFQDAGEEGLAGFWAYLDLNNNDNPDLGEPGTNSLADGTYRIDFPGPGPFTIRVETQPGFELTTPPSGEYTNGNPNGNDFDFGFRPSLDFGDAPDSYGTTGVDAAKHGISDSLTIGALVDRELTGQPTADAMGDDTTDLDDEDGVQLLSPLGPGSPATFAVAVSNTAGGSAFLQGFMDFNGDGDFTDLGEKFASDILVESGFVGTKQVPINVPANAEVGDTFARFRLSRLPGLGATGFVATGEVEDYAFPILTDAKIANDDTATAPRNSTTQIDVLANDFQTSQNQLRITSLVLNGVEESTQQPFTTVGSVRIADDFKSVFYTPPSGFIGRDTFGYTVVDNFGNADVAYVTVNVTFQTEVPIALDDIFSVPEGASNRALNVLDNDVSSIFGGISITSATRGSAGGTVTIVGGGQSLRYTPTPGFNGTEQFTYSLQDAAGQTDSATVTVNLLPGSLADDKIDFSIGIFDPRNTNREISNVQVGEEFLVRFFVDDIARMTLTGQGVASAFLDVLYSDELASVVTTNTGPDIIFGPLFIGGVQSSNIQTPGLIDEIGAVQDLTPPGPVDHLGRTELFTVKMKADSPGVAVIQGDPADVDENPQSETVLVQNPNDDLGDRALTVAEQRFGRMELLIAPASDNFTSAIDDSYPDSRDSENNLIVFDPAGTGYVLDVLANDNFGSTGTVREFSIKTGGNLFGDASIDNNGTPNNANDDFVRYLPNPNANGLERFTYQIVTEDNIVSSAEVTISLGNQAANADVFYDMSLVRGDGSGAPLNSDDINLGDRIGILVTGNDLRFTPTYVFAGFQDVLYNTDVLSPANTDQGDGFDFDVQFGPFYVSDPDINASAIRPGIIDEIGTFSTAVGANPNINGSELFTLFFDVIGSGPLGVVGSPADSKPFSDTLLFNVDDPIAVSDIRYDKLDDVLVLGPQQNGRLAQDVNNDGFVTPIDALLVINQLSQSGAEGEQAGSSGSGNSYYTDVNGDSFVTALDALQVINYLVRSSDDDASGEQVAVLQGNSASGSGAASSDSVITDLSDEDNIVDAGALGASNGAAVVVVASDSSMADDDEDDLLSLLADDVAGQWS